MMEANDSVQKEAGHLRADAEGQRKNLVGAAYNGHFWHGMICVLTRWTMSKDFSRISQKFMATAVSETIRRLSRGWLFTMEPR